MRGLFQDEFYHGVPPQPGRHGERINFTWRWDEGDPFTLAPFVAQEPVAGIGAPSASSVAPRAAQGSVPAHTRPVARSVLKKECCEPSGAPLADPLRLAVKSRRVSFGAQYSYVTPKEVDAWRRRHALPLPSTDVSLLLSKSPWAAVAPRDPVMEAAGEDVASESAFPLARRVAKPPRNARASAAKVLAMLLAHLSVVVRKRGAQRRARRAVLAL